MSDSVGRVQEIDKGDEDIVGVDMEAGQLLVNEPRQKVDLTKYTERHKFIFDDVLDHYVDNDDVYIHTVQSLVHTIFKLGKATCFAYGQTGSGKTYTMSPLPPRAAAEILTLLQSPRYSDLALFVSCFEIYGGKVRARALTGMGSMLVATGPLMGLYHRRTLETAPGVRAIPLVAHKRRRLSLTTARDRAELSDTRASSGEQALASRG